jgi:putative Ca2+/H+ antiporter (TMEM165/GDT1 family)
MSPKTAATGFAVSRVVFGLGLALAPGRAGASWIGRKAAARPQTQIFARALGARDVVLGAGALRALRRDDRDVARLLVMGAAAADGTDVLAALAARRHLPSPLLAFVVVAATVYTGVNAWSAKAL